MSSENGNQSVKAWDMFQNDEAAELWSNTWAEGALYDLPKFSLIPF